MAQLKLLDNGEEEEATLGHLGFWGRSTYNWSGQPMRWPGIEHEFHKSANIPLKVASYTRHRWSIILANAPNEAPNGNLYIFKKLYIVLKLQIIPRHHNCGHSSCPIDDCSTALRMPMVGLLPNHKHFLWVPNERSYLYWPDHLNHYYLQGKQHWIARKRLLTLDGQCPKHNSRHANLLRLVAELPLIWRSDTNRRISHSSGVTVLLCCCLSNVMMSGWRWTEPRAISI